MSRREHPNAVKSWNDLAACSPKVCKTDESGWAVTAAVMALQQTSESLEPPSREEAHFVAKSMLIQCRVLLLESIFQ